MYELLGGIQPEVAFIRLPIVAPQVKQLTASGLYAEAIQYGQKKIDETVMNVSILGGFTYGDTPFNGMSFIVTTRGDKARAKSLCRELAEQVWQGRERLLPELTPLSDCIEMAVALGNDPAKPPVVIADVADNPGGGGRGNTAWLLKGLYEASAKTRY